MPDLNAAEKPKLVLEYQITDEAGQPLVDPRTGKPLFTNLTADTPEEMMEKQKKAHIEATRALYRARNHKPVPKQAEAAPTVLTPEEERQAATDLQDPTKARTAIRKLGGLDEIEKETKAAREAKDRADARAAAFQFMSRHLTDYFPCEANSSLMSAEINAQGLDPRVVENYEVAFNSVADKLAQRPVPEQEPPKEEPPKKQAAGTIQPGELTGTRTIQRRLAGIPTKDGPITIEKLKEMRKTDEGRAEYRRRLKMDPAFGPAVDALLAKR